ncbi:cysteine and glycine-rich protein [Pholiota molesta]|nr:cysteine and glycine-rich protein [Pholiota molesta]
MYAPTPSCPTCAKPVYLAEQTMGPGRKLYHKPCLACKSCNKRLDSFTLLEHDQEPYCKSCHMKLFGTRDLRHANLPVAPPPSSSPTASPTSSPLRANPTGSTTYTATHIPSTPPPRPSFWSTKAANGSARSSSPTYMRVSGRIPAWDDAEDSMDTKPDPGAVHDTTTDEETEVHDALMSTPAHPSIPEADEHNLAQDSRTMYAGSTSSQATPVQVRTIPLNLNTAGGRAGSPYRHHTSNSVGAGASPVRTSSPLRENTTGGSGSTGFGSTPGRGAFASAPGYASGAFSGYAGEAAGPNMSPQALRPMATGTRYGAALGGGGAAAGGQVKAQSTGSPRKWGGETPLCERCGKSVYFAEQVKAVNKTFHKACLRCTECGTSLDSRNLRDHEGVLFCGRCYGKNYGPQGGGYALLGKAGG